ncbi:carboxylic ester hydrolase [Halopseudomonas salina]|uniref:Carboxylic ester hydrolase n=1 Tax=Halopseudomonas salina TaxID=1323744 RepID=A0ABQ1PTV0_9GAMM|nr:carboxylic ester hydrolase [Halopseudomonas salina]
MATPDPLTVTTTEGAIKGVTLEGVEGIRVFRGIPYAEPPVGELRFAPTVPAEDRSETLQLSDAFGSSCVQIDLAVRAPAGNEDCLYLNVYAPESGENLPVMVWLHGGAFVFGNGGGEYDPTRLVKEDVIVVTLNYRLGLLGFLAHPNLESDGGNFGLMDQQQALRWVKENAAAFGGDSNNVTIFGESAGGHSVMSHIASPRAKEENLFQRAIVQSGSYAAFQQSKVDAQATGETAATALGCADGATAATCLRALPAMSFLAVQGSQVIPNSDPTTDLLPVSIQTALATGSFNQDLDIMIGSNQDEGTLFVALDELTGDPLDVLGEAEYRTRVADLFEDSGLDADAIATYYLNEYPTGANRLSLALSAIWTDSNFACNSYAQASTFANSNMNTYQYWFRDENAPWTLVPAASFPLGATHAGEIPYVLYPEQVMRDRYTGDKDELDALASDMVGYWAQFAKDGNPNSTDGVAPNWAQVSAGQINTLDVSSPGSGSNLNFLGYHRCGYWATPPLAAAPR